MKGGTLRHAKAKAMQANLATAIKAKVDDY